MNIKMTSKVSAFVMTIALFGQNLSLGRPQPKPNPNPDSLSDSGVYKAAEVTRSQDNQPRANQAQAGQARDGQDQPPIRVKTELIELRAVVTDKRGQPISDLKKEDFELTENGKRQEVGFF